MAPGTFFSTSVRNAIPKVSWIRRSDRIDTYPHHCACSTLRHLLLPATPLAQRDPVRRSPHAVLAPPTPTPMISLPIAIVSLALEIAPRHNWHATLLVAASYPSTTRAAATERICSLLNRHDGIANGSDVKLCFCAHALFPSKS